VLTRVIAIVVIMAAMGANVIQQPAAPGGGITCDETSPTWSEDFDGATACIGDTCDNSGWAEEIVGTGSDNDADAAGHTGDGFPGQELHSLGSTASGTERAWVQSGIMSGSDARGTWTFSFRADVLDLANNEEAIIFSTYASTTNEPPAVVVETDGAGAETIHLYCDTASVASATLTKGVLYKGELRYNESGTGAVDRCALTLYECTASNDLANCNPTPVIDSDASTYNFTTNASRIRAGIGRRPSDNGDISNAGGSPQNDVYVDSIFFWQLDFTQRCGP